MMSRSEFDRVVAAADQLVINRAGGEYHKPLALIWAIDRALRGLPRLVSASTVRFHLDPLLEELTGVDSNAAWPWLKLANDLGSAWLVDGAHPSGDPPAHFVAGWSRSTYLAIAGRPDGARQLIGTMADKYLRDVYQPVSDALGLEIGAAKAPDTVIVAARQAYDEYLAYSAYICQSGRSFRPVERLGFYRQKRIEPLLPLIEFTEDEVVLDEANARRLEQSEDPAERKIGELIAGLLADGSERLGQVQQVFLLSDPASDATLNLDEPIEHTGPSAWTQGQRYTSGRALRAARTTGDLS